MGEEHSRHTKEKVQRSVRPLGLRLSTRGVPTTLHDVGSLLLFSC